MTTTEPKPAVPYQRIATEEAFAPAEMINIYRKILAKSDVDPGFQGLMGFYMSSPSARALRVATACILVETVPASNSPYAPSALGSP